MPSTRSQGALPPSSTATACGLIQEARRHPEKIGKVFAGRDGIIGALTEDLIDTSLESDEDIARLRSTPGGAFGSCRYKLKSLEDHRAQYERLIEVFKAHDIGYFFYNGGNDSMDTAWKVSQIAEKMGYPVVCVGVPKTVDNDLPLTDCCPGFGSVAKYVATSIREAGYDVASMSRTSTKIFVLEVMGRHAGWITAACGLASENVGEPPHILLFPEVPFNPEKFLVRVQECVTQYGYCTVAVSEGLSDAEGKLIADSGTKDAFGHSQLGGVGQIVAQLIKDKLGYKYHWALADYLQRSARHLASRTDVEQAHAIGVAAVDLALQGKNAVMATINRLSDVPYRWEIGDAPLKDIANVERKMPVEFITADGFHITDACREYLQPLIEGEDPPPYRNGLPDYVRLKNISVEKKLETFKI
jgi:6-phosphofructokinase